jgi:hypothetical protein
MRAAAPHALSARIPDCTPQLARDRATPAEIKKERAHQSAAARSNTRLNKPAKLAHIVI